MRYRAAVLSDLFLSLIALAIVVGSSGCASDRGTTRTDFDPVYFGAQDSTVRFVVLGDTRTVLPSYDETPPIERFLYGSNSAGKTILRNPQGLALAGQRLLICDQGCRMWSR